MGVLTLGLNHTTAPLDVRGRFAFAPDALHAPLRELTERLVRSAPEAALLLTARAGERKTIRSTGGSSGSSRAAVPRTTRSTPKSR